MKLRKILCCFAVLFSLVLTSCTIIVPAESVNVKFEDAIISYDGESHSLEIEGSLKGNQAVRYSENSFSKIGSYDVTAEVYNTQTNEVLKTLEANLTIKGELESKEYLYNGENHGLSLNGEVDDSLVVVFSNNDQVEVGKYHVTCSLYESDTMELVDEYRAIMTIDNPEHEAFEKYLDEFFVEIFAGDQMSVNFFFKNPENYGIEHYDAALPTYTGDYDFDADQVAMQEMLDELHAFESEALSNEQRDTYEIVDRYLTYIYNITENMNYMTNSYLGSYLGYQCNLPLNLAEYKFRNEQDIQDFIDYLVNAEESFKSYVEFTKDQIKYGYPMPDSVIDNVVSQCVEFVEMGEENFLITIFNEKIDAITFELSSNTIDGYKDAAKDAILGSLTNAYKYVQDNLPSLKGNATDSKGLAMYGDEGKEYYLLEMSNILGYENIDGEALFKYLIEKFDEINNKLNNVIERMSSLSDVDYMNFINAALYGNPSFSDLSYENVVSYFQDAFKSFVPEIEEMPEINIKNVPDALTDSFSPAAYFVSPIDETKYEVIYLNQKYIDDYNYIFTTLAHEGFAGHLYQNVYIKSLDIHNIRKVLECKGYSEGWATYVEIESYFYAPAYQTNPGLKLASEYLALDNQFNLIINALFDLCIHYQGMNCEELASFLSSLLGAEYTAADFIDAYNQICEIPTNMSMYAISFLIFDELRTLATNSLGEHFNIVEFNKVILDCGAAPFEMIEEAVRDYINDVKFMNNL